MKTKTKTQPATAEKSTSEFPLVPASVIAPHLSVTPRYVHLLAEQGKIPAHRFGRGCVRYNLTEVLTALGIVAPSSL